MSDISDTLLNDLRESISRGEAVVIAGAGMAVDATELNPVASWKGLLLDGIERCRDVADLPLPQAESLKILLEGNDVGLWLSVAEIVQSKLKERSEFGRWLSETIGKLKISKRDTLDALVGLQVPLLTTNYDNLLEEATGYPPVTWKHPSRFERLLKKDVTGIGHLHGHFDDPDSIVLGVRTYEAIKNDQFTQATLRALRYTRTLIFVGFGKGLSDPNFDAFLQWSRTVFKESHFRHFRLARKSEVDAISREHEPSDRIFVLPYGEAYEDLAPFLSSLAPQSRAPPKADAVTPGERHVREDQQDSASAFHAEIDLAKGYTKKGQPDVAIALLEKLRFRLSSNYEERIHFRLLANLGTAFHEKDDFAKAAIYYLQASGYEQSSGDSRCYKALGHFVRNQQSDAFTIAASVVKEFPSHTLAHAIWIRSAPDEMTFAEIDGAIPEHIKASEDVAHALMQAALVRESLTEAEKYGRATLQALPDSPLVLGQLGSVFVEQARHLLRDLDAEMLPKEAMRLAREAADYLTRSVALSGQHLLPKHRANAQFLLGMAYEILGDVEASNKNFRLAYDTSPDDPQIAVRFAMNLAGAGGSSAALAIIQQLPEEAKLAYRGAEAIVLIAHGEPADKSQALTLLHAELKYIRAINCRPEFESACRFIELCIELDQPGIASEWLDQMGSSDVARKILTAVYMRLSGNTAGAMGMAQDVAKTLSDTTVFFLRRALARELTYLNLYADAFALWSQLISPAYVSVDTRMAITAAYRSDNPRFILDFCTTLRNNGFFDKHCIVHELEIWNTYNCPDTIKEVITAACSSDRLTEPFKQSLRVSVSQLGLELGRNDWIVTDSALLPKAEEAPPTLGRSVTQLLTYSHKALEGIQYAYTLLRANFESADAHMAMIGSILLGNGKGLNLPKPEEVAAGTAVAYLEEDSEVPKWWVIEDNLLPSIALRELSPQHPTAAKFLGAKVGDQVVLRDGSIQARTVKISSVLSKYVYRFQQCMADFEDCFPGEEFLYRFNAKPVELDGPPDIAAIERSVEQRHEWIRQVEHYYRKSVPSMNAFAQIAHAHVLDVCSHLCATSHRIKCCRGSNEELGRSMSQLRASKGLVLEGSALATLFCTGMFRHIEGSNLQVLVTYGTVRGFRRTLLERMNTKASGFLSKRGDRLVYEQYSEEQRETLVAEMSRFMDWLYSIAEITEGSSLANVLPNTRQWGLKHFGRPAVESAAIAAARDYVLWADDLPVSEFAQLKLGAKWAWSQCVLSHLNELHVLAEEAFHACTVSLQRASYSKTRVTSECVLHFGRRSEWRADDDDLSVVLGWLGGVDVPPVSLLAIVEGVLRPLALESASWDRAASCLFSTVRGRFDGEQLLTIIKQKVESDWAFEDEFKRYLLSKLQGACDGESSG